MAVIFSIAPYINADLGAMLKMARSLSADPPPLFKGMLNWALLLSMPSSAKSSQMMQNES